MTRPTRGSQVNVPAAPDPEPPPADAAGDEGSELCGTTTLQVPASPSVAFTCVCEVSDRWRTVAIPVSYPLLAAPGLPALCVPKTPDTSTDPAATATTAPTTSQRRWPHWCGPPDRLVWSEAVVLVMALHRQPSARRARARTRGRRAPRPGIAASSGRCCPA